MTSRPDPHGLESFIWRIPFQRNLPAFCIFFRFNPKTKEVYIPLQVRKDGKLGLIGGFYELGEQVLPGILREISEELVNADGAPILKLNTDNIFWILAAKAFPSPAKRIQTTVLGYQLDGKEYKTLKQYEAMFRNSLPTPIQTFVHTYGIQQKDALLLKEILKQNRYVFLLTMQALVMDKFMEKNDAVRHAVTSGDASAILKAGLKASEDGPFDKTWHMPLSDSDRILLHTHGEVSGLRFMKLKAAINNPQLFSIETQHQLVKTLDIAVDKALHNGRVKNGVLQLPEIRVGDLPETFRTFVLNNPPAPLYR